MTPQEIFVRNRARFRGLYEKVRLDHEAVIASGKTTLGHGFDHAIMVAQYGAMFSETDREGDMTWVAGLMHNTDRHYSPNEASRVIGGYLELISFEFSESERKKIREAVEKHSKLNEDSDNSVTRALKDADRVANSGPINIFRCALHNYDKQAFVLEEMSLERPSSKSTFKTPNSCFDAFFFNEEWRGWLRMPKAIVFAQKHFDYLREHQRAIIAQLEEAGLYPWVK